MKKLRKIRVWKKILIWVLCLSITLQSIPLYAQGQEKGKNEIEEQLEPIAIFSEDSDKEEDEIGGIRVEELEQIETELSTEEMANTTEENLEEVKEEVLEEERTKENTSTQQSQEENLSESQSEEEEKEKAIDTSHIYENGIIKIYNEKQLKAIGTGKPVKNNDNEENQFGTGETVVVDKKEVVYGFDSKYQLMKDIPLEYDNMWSLPEGFTGSFVGSQIDENVTLYEDDTDTIHIYHNYQLLTLASKEAKTEPVLSKDMMPKEFGIGQLIYPNGIEDEQAYLKYSKEHNYVLDQNFTEKMPKLKSSVVKAKATTEEGAEGRDFKGQVVYKDEETGEEYILIGNKEQLKAIGSGDRVYTAIYQAKLQGVKWVVDTDNNGNPIMLYGGDADLSKEQNGKKDYAFGQIEKASGILTGRCGVNQETGEIDPNMDIEDSGKKYDMDENYIIFRDIELGEGEQWKPLMFSGVMEGRLGMVEGSQVTIRNINVNQSGKLPVDEYTGIGFFGTISSEATALGGASKKHVEVSNLILDGVSVTNNSSEVEADLSIIGAIIGGLFNILDLLSKDQTTFATGGFAGRISGDVTVSGCEVHNLKQLYNVKDISGGFVGNLEGVTRYEPLTGGVVGGLITVLEKLLNIIPILGLGDLISILLGQDGLIPIGNLIPIGYYNPTIENCKVEGVSAKSIGNQETRFNGGFAGRQIGSFVKNSNVVSNQDLTIQGSSFIGGFSGAIVNAEIEGVLNDLGIELADFGVQSVVAGCEVDVPLTIIASKNYIGGFAGILANSFAIDPCIKNLKSVSGKEEVGGLIGYASLGWGTAVGDEFDDYKDNLLNAVVKLLGGVLTGDSAADLLSLIGIQPAKIFGAQVSGDNLQISATGSYVGGMIGRSDGLVLGTSTQETVNQLRPFEKGKVSYIAKEKDNFIHGLGSVKANENYAGGLIGKVTTASVAGILDATISLGNYLPFEIENINITGVESGYTVLSKEEAGGVVGEAVGGTIQSVHIDNIGKVSASHYAGGFAAITGTGSLAGSGGLDILGLGLIKVEGLLSVVDAIETKIQECSVTGISKGFEVCIENQNPNKEDRYLAGGFLANSASTVTDQCHVKNLKLVRADMENGIAGGFAALSTASSLASVAGDDGIGIEGIIDINGLLDAVNYLVPKYDCCTVYYVTNNNGEAQVKADLAGGFVGEFQSGMVNQEENSSIEDTDAVKGLECIEGIHYAGGFGGKIYAGGLVDAGGLSLLGGLIKLDVGNLIRVMNVYIPRISYAGVQSAQNGFTVKATAEESYAGGYLGFGSGVQIDHSDVSKLKHTTVIPPEDLESEEAPSYYDLTQSSYAIQAGTYAGGYVGRLDIGNIAQLGDSLDVLGLLDIGNLTQALAVAASTITDSSVTGTAGGYSVLANGEKEQEKYGYAGGYAGGIYGSKIVKSDAIHFAYIIGRDSGGGYVGTLEPGDVASVIKDTSILGGIITIKGSLASLIESFVPFIEDCQTIAVPCGGVVRAEKLSDGSTAAGVAGGYVGHSLGGQIEGKTRECKVDRLRSVFGSEYAGGFSGWSEGANVADTGSLNVLFGLIKANNPLQLAEAVYPVERNTRVYGPLRNMTYEQWNSWANAIGKGGAYGEQLQSWLNKSEEEKKQIYETKIKNYAYGYHVVSGRREASNQRFQGGMAGGYIGRMDGGVIENAIAYDVKKVSALKSAGGFVGEMRTGSVANVGSISLVGIDILDSLSLIQAFVPVIKSSSAIGYQSGAVIQAIGITEKNAKGDITGAEVGYAGGFAGYIVGGQIGEKKDEKEEEGNHPAKCSIKNLRRIDGTSYVGGYAGRIDSGSVLDLNTDESGLLNQILKYIINTDELVQVLNATISTIQEAEVVSWDDWGMMVNGAYLQGDITQYAKAVGGFAGSIQGAIIGTQDKDGRGIHGTKVEGIREVIGGEYVGGYVGLADVGAAVALSGNGTTILDLITLGAVDVADMFRTYIFDSQVSGSTDYGLTVSANSATSSGTMDSTVWSGNAGGFAGSFLNGTVEDSKVLELRSVAGLNNTGGFIGYSGKSGLVDVDEVEVGDKDGIFSLLNGTVGVLDVFGSTVENCQVTGVGTGFMVSSQNGTKERAGGFVGFADLARITKADVINLKQVSSGKTAGGFAGETSFAYLGNIQVSSIVLKILVPALNLLLEALQVPDLAEGDLIHINIPGLLEVNALYDGDVVSVNLLGLKIAVCLVTEDGNENQFLQVAIGDSVIQIPCHDGKIDKEEADLEIFLIKANRTRIAESTVTGIEDGYDVYAGGSGNEQDASAEKDNGRSGGFVGYNNEGLLEKNTMFYCDVVKGNENEVGPFTGVTSLQSEYDFNTIANIEGNQNTYRIYREAEETFDEIKQGNKKLNSDYLPEEDWNQVYVVNHITGVEKFEELKDAVMHGEGVQDIDLKAYETSAKAVLMKDVPTQADDPSTSPEPPDMQDPCDEKVMITVHKVWKDFGNLFGTRPEQVTITLWRTYIDQNGEKIHEKVPSYEEIIITGDKSSTWKKIIKDLPAGYIDRETQKIIYYTYSVTETPVDGYTTEVDKVDNFTFTITNSKGWQEILPDTGGIGITAIYMLGILLFGTYLGMTSYKRRKCSKQ